MSESSEREELARGILIGFLAGAAMGVILGLLFAPKSGRELRKNIHDRADTFIANTGDVVAAVGTHDGVIGPPDPRPWLSEKDVEELARGELKGG